MPEYHFNEIERKWQQRWAEQKTYKTGSEPGKPKYFVLDMFPYPSGAGLHVGHPLGYIASDIIARYKKLKGFNVLHPMGYDAFGLPAEQYAIQTGQHPAITTEQNIQRYREQLDKIGLGYDWDREVRTSDPAYYKWTQWIFIQLFNSWYNCKAGKAESIETLIHVFNSEGFKGEDHKTLTGDIEHDLQAFSADEWKNYDEKQQQEILLHFRLAYLSETYVNWCPALGTVLSNDEVKDGLSERGGHPVERKLMKQWSMRITAYADRLLRDLDTIDWSESMKEAQRNWIGKSEGSSIKFSLTPGPSPRERGDAAYAAPKEQRHGYQTAKKEIWETLKERARDHRKNPTEAEELLWQRVRNSNLGYKIRRQHAIDQYIPDFVCLNEKLIIEVDGGIHIQQKEYDEQRTLFLAEIGYRVIRFTNEEVLNKLDWVCDKIQEALSTPFEDHSSPFSAGEGPGDEAGVEVEVFTTRPDTIFGVTFLTLAPESELVQQITTNDQKQAVDEYVTYAKNRSERDRQAEVKKITGQFTGAYAIHPFTGKQIPVWVGDYVLAGYGTGAVMGVPGHDSRDHAFAKHFGLDILQVIETSAGHDILAGSYDEKIGRCMNSDFLNGLEVKDAIKKAIAEIEKKGVGKGKTNYRLRDAIFGRQRYWGEPIPIYYKDGLPYSLPESELPLLLPEVDKYLPTEDGEPPLARAKDWKYKGQYEYELTTMPGWAGSSWYFLRYMDPHNDKEFASKEAMDYWQNVDLYLGGSEHATGHLLYVRFWTKFLFDRGFIRADEPAKKLINQGMIQGRSNFVYRIKGENKYVSFGLKENYDTTPLRVDVNIVLNDELNIDAFRSFKNSALENPGVAEFILENGKYLCGAEVEKMSKSKWNVVSPDDVCQKYGADTLRLYEMFLGPLEQSKPWSTSSIDGVSRFLRKLWKLFYDEQGNWKVNDEAPTPAELKSLHKTIRKVEEDVERYSFNTSVSSFMICVNELTEQKCSKRGILQDLLVILSPYAPHIAEELWEQLGNKESITKASFPNFDASYLVENSFSYPISINGKHRLNIEMDLSLSAAEVEQIVSSDEGVQKFLDGKPPKKVVFVKGRIVNIVV